VPPPSLPLIIGVAGGTGSGKTTVTRKIEEAVGSGRVAVIPQDAYYLDLTHLDRDARRRTNYDHPDAFDTALLVRHLAEIKEGRPVDRPVYSFVEDNRLPQTVRVVPCPVVVLEGLFVLYEAAVRDLLDIKVFVDADPDVRFIRRLRRDTRERGRTTEAVIDQYLATVRPMHLQFVEPSKRWADLIVPHGGHNEVALDVLATKIRSTLAGSQERAP
jgi:uridine kinase